MQWNFGQKIINKLKGKKKNKNSKAINERLHNAKYVHIMHNDKFIKPFVDFLNRNFDKEEHLVLCKRWCKQFSFPEGKNVIEINSLADLKFENVEKIFCHSLFDDELVKYLYKHKNILKEKAYWVIWGGDLYNAQRDEINDYVRCNFKAYINKCDESVCREKYNAIQSDKVFYNAAYIFPITKTMLDNTKKTKKSYVQIQINNSCDKSTLEVLDYLKKYKDENIKIVTILSYGQMDYKEEIIKKGKKIFDDKFTYIDNYLSPEKYSQHLANNDILILNQNRQQGVGNTMASLYLGIKVFIRSEISVYKSLTNDGIKVFDTNNIPALDYNEFVYYDKREINQNIVSSFFDENCVARQWEYIFKNS